MRRSAEAAEKGDGKAHADFPRRLHPEVMWAKFGSLVEGARLASGRVWKVGSGRNGNMSTAAETTSDGAPARDRAGKLAGTMVPEWQKIPPPEPGELPRTPSEIEGPYFRLAAPERSNLLEPGDEPQLVLTGRVLNEKGKPIAGAIVNVWSSDLGGDYDMVGHRYTGYQVTDGEGRYEFTTIIPGCYYPRDAKHLHVMVQGVSSPLVTQLYIGGEPGNYEDDFYHPALLVECTEDENGVKHGSFDFVIKQVTEQENVTRDSLAARA